ncbi:MerR family transcriptional regulator [Cohnella sp.]|uniref:MerR family transcriptional regulator n=1 Tax=Cohnella sp. TaxID=1883426 RepID=UPI003561B23C
MDKVILKTKDAAELLGVSQTTIKRWASHFPSFFHKDRNGHYALSDKQISLLIYIKDRVEQGDSLDQITLPTNPVLEPLKPFDSLTTPMDDMISRLREVERSLEQKADEVVSAQVLQHRVELEELRQVVAQLAASVETMRNPAPKPISLPRNDYPLKKEPSEPHKRKRRFFLF